MIFLVHFLVFFENFDCSAYGLAIHKYRAWCDVLMIALEDGKQYTLAEADAAIDKFKTAKVVEKVNGKE